MAGQLGPFMLEKPVGQGTTASVWRGHHQETGTPVAIKVIPMAAETKDSDIYRYRAEVRSIARIVHRGVVRIYDEGVVTGIDTVGEADESLVGSPYIVMEWAEDGTLAQHPPLSHWGDLKRILLSVLDALAAAHARGVIHRDIKPQNILLSAGRAILTDFGIAFERHSPISDPHLSQVMGSPNYMAPEQVLCRWREFGPWTDLYSVGCVAWFLTTGHAPFKRQRSRDVLVAHVKDDPPIFTPFFELPQGFEAWTRRLLAKRPTNRFRFAADAAAALERLEDAPSTTKHHTSSLTVEPGKRRDERLSRMELGPSITALSSFSSPAPTLTPKLAADWRRPENIASANDPLIGIGLSVFTRTEGAFVGRENERDLLWNNFHAVARAKASRACFISGSAGSGKSALSRWFVSRLHESGAAEILLCRHQNGQDSLDSLRKMVENYFTAWDLDESERLRHLRQRLRRWESTELAAELNAFIDAGQRVGIAKQTIALVSEKERYMTLCRLVHALSRERPVVILIEDAQWGEFALEWAKYALSDHADLNVLWLFTWRSNADRDHLEAQTSKFAIQSLDVCDDIDLKPLGANEARALIQARLQLDDTSLDALVERADGNPLFAELLVEHWIREGRLDWTGAGFRVSDLTSSRLPDSVHELWQKRLSWTGLLDNSNQQWALELAAVLGQQFWRNTWISACQLAQVPRAKSVLATLEQNGLLRREEDGQFCFVHALLNESILRLAQDGQRLRRWHAACAQALMVETPTIWYQVARHQAGAERYEDAVASLRHDIEHRHMIGDLKGRSERLVQMIKYLRLARVPRTDLRWAYVRINWGSNHGSLGVQTSALRHARNARRYLDQECEAHRALYAEAALGEGLAVKFVYNHRTALDYVVHARDAAVRSEDRALEFESRRLHSSLLRELGELALSAEEFIHIQALMKGDWLQRLPTHKRQYVEINFHLESTKQAWLSGEHEQALHYAREAETLALRSGARSRSGLALNFAGRVLLDLQRYDEAYDYYMRSHDLLARVGHTDRFTSLGYAAVCLAQLGDYDGALENYHSFTTGLRNSGRLLSARLGQPFMLGALARVGEWTQWDEILIDFTDLVKRNGYSIIFARVVELSVPHLLDLRQWGRTKKLLDVLIRVYEAQGGEDDLERLRTRYPDALERALPPT
ncbi:MAG: protein kinase [Myxococcota bacterium]|nr:protein kinase [Myxococcota bacterium]